MQADDQNDKGPVLTKPVIGLVGAPGSGKSAAAAALAELGCGVIDADALAREAIQAEPVKRQIVQWWGDEVLDDQGRVDRAAVGRRVFDNPDELKRLESLLHPKVHKAREAARQAMNNDSAIVAIVEDCPLLLETGLERQCDAIVMIDADLAIRQERVRETRGWDAAELARRESRQMPLDMKRKAADYVVQNEAGVCDLSTQLDSVLRQVLQQFQAGVSG